MVAETGFMLKHENMKASEVTLTRVSAEQRERAEVAHQSRPFVEIGKGQKSFSMRLEGKRIPPVPCRSARPIARAR